MLCFLRGRDWLGAQEQGNQWKSQVAEGAVEGRGDYAMLHYTTIDGCATITYLRWYDYIPQLQPRVLLDKEISWEKDSPT